MLTDREHEILGWIREDPSITQKEIAERASISRSSVAVHISNLTKKGALLGRRYVLAESSYIVVVGGANMDVAGKPERALVAHDSNPGSVSMSAGGAGRNIAHNLALLGCDTKLVSAFGDDARARELQERCREAGIDVASSLTVPGGTTSTYVFIMNEQGDMELAISDMKIFDQLTPDNLERRMPLIERAALCVVDTNIPAESLRYLAEHAHTPLFCDPVSTKKAVKLKGIVGRLHTLKPNRIEAEVLTGVHIHDDASLRHAAEVLLGTGLEQVFISLDREGLLCANRERMVKLPTLCTNVVNATGAGDTLMAAITWAYLEDAPLEEQGLAGLVASAACMEAPTTINTHITQELVRTRMDAARGSFEVVSI